MGEVSIMQSEGLSNLSSRVMFYTQINVETMKTNKFYRGKIFRFQ